MVQAWAQQQAPPRSRPGAIQVSRPSLTSYGKKVAQHIGQPSICIINMMALAELAERKARPARGRPECENGGGGRGGSQQAQLPLW